MLFYCSEHMQKRESNICELDTCSFLRFSLPTNTEPDGKVTIGEVLSSPDEKLAREVIRVIRASKGHWVPRRVRGVPQRTAYEYRINFT